MKNNTLLRQEAPEKETPPAAPPEHPVIKPAIHPEKEKNEPFHPVPEIQPATHPEIKPGKAAQKDDYNHLSECARSFPGAHFVNTFGL